MSPSPRVEEDERFIETCLEIQLLGDEDADVLRHAIGKEDRGISQTAVQKGLLSPSDIDIVHCLQRPREIVPGYQILGLVGRGGMGVVYRAQQLDLERTVALKIILISKVTEANVSVRFEREAKALARLQHPNIVQALNFGKHEGRYYFAMEYVPGRNGEQLIRENGRLSPQLVWSVVRQVASALMHARRQNLIHRDIKPANLILVPAPEGATSETTIVKLTDFGLAMFADQSAEQMRLTTGDKVMGSPTYMSPEQFSGRQVDFRSDMYSLGATAWHLLFGKPPHQGRTIGALYQQKSERLVLDPATMPVSLPEDQLSLLTGMMDPDPSQRPESYEQLIDVIDRLGFGFASPSLATASMVEMSDELVESISRHPTVVRGNIDPAAETNAVREAPAAASVVTQTVDVPVQPPVSTRPALRAIRWGLAAAVIVVLLIVTLPNWNSRGERRWTRIVSDTPLFDGETLSGWDVGGSMVGAWNTVEAPDASTAIACTTAQGALTRRLPPCDHPRISLFVWLQPKVGAVDIDFGVDPTRPNDRRGTLRLTALSSRLGEKQSDFGELDVFTEQSAPAFVFDRFQVIDIERQPTDWFIFLEERFVGSIPISSIGDEEAIRLVIHENESVSNETPQVYFADVQLYELEE